MKYLLLIIAICLLTTGCSSYHEADTIKVVYEDSTYVINNCTYTITHGEMSGQYYIKIVKYPSEHTFRISSCSEILIVPYKGI